MSKNTQVKEPMFHIVKRSSIVWWKAWIIRAVAVFAALFVGGTIVQEVPSGEENVLFVEA